MPLRSNQVHHLRPIIYRSNRIGYIQYSQINISYSNHIVLMSAHKGEIKSPKEPILSVLRM